MSAPPSYRRRAKRTALRTLIAAAAWAFAAPSMALDDFTLTGFDASAPRVVISLVEGSTLTPCRMNDEALQRCLVVDAEKASEITAAYADQVVAQGFAPFALGPNAFADLLAFAPAQSNARCPQVVMIHPHMAEREASAPLPPNTVFLTLNYMLDTCLLQSGRL